MMEGKKAHGGDVFGLASEERERILDFSININPLGMSPKGKTAALAQFEREIMRYPDVECREMKAALRQRYGIPEKMILCGNGATELMYVAVRMLRPSAVYAAAPSFSEYRFAAEAASVPVHTFRLDRNRDFQPGDDSFLDEMPEHSMIFLGNPNNPDGQLLRRETFHKFAEAAAKKNGWLIIDESFIDFVGDEASFRNEIFKSPNLMVILSLTKFYAVPGLRIGAAFMRSDLAQRLQSGLYPWNVNGLVQVYMKEAVLDEAYAANSRKYLREERSRMDEMLRRIPGLRVYDGRVNFFLLQLTGRIDDAARLEEALLPYHIHIRQCGNFEGLDHSFFRAAVRRKEENDRLMKALNEVLRA